MDILTFNLGKDRRNLVDDVTQLNFTGSAYNWVQARQYENEMRQAEVHVLNEDGTPFDLTGANYVFEGLLPDDTHRIIDAKHGIALDPQGGVFRFDFPAPVFAMAGSYKQAFFRIYKQGKNIATLEFSMEVLADKVISGLVPADYITPFEDLYSKLEDIVLNADGRFKDELESMKKLVDDLVSNTNLDIKDLLEQITKLQNTLDAINAQIKAGNIVTKEDLDNVLKDYVKTEDIDNLLKDYVKTEDIDNVLKDYVKTEDIVNFQKVQMTKDKGEAYYYIKKGDTPTFNDILTKNVGVKTFYLQANAVDGVSDSMRGIINTSNLSLPDSKTYGNAIGVTNDGRVFRKTIIFDVPNNKYVISDWVSVDNGVWSDWITSGIVYSNGYSAYHPKDRQNRYRYKDVMLRNGDIERTLEVDISTTRSKGFVGGVPAWTLPKSVIGDVGFWDFLGVTASSDSSFTSYTFNNKGQFYVHGSTLPSSRNDAWLPLTRTFTYIYKKGVK